MRNLKSENGISLIALVVTVIVLLILTEISMIIVKQLIIDNAIMASAKTTEAMLEERLEMIWMEIETSYWMNAEKNSIVKSDYFKEKLKEGLESSEGIKDVDVKGNIETAVDVTLSYKNEKYEFEILSDGSVNTTPVIDIVQSLKENVKIGDFIEYPYEYEDVYSGNKYTSSNGWRILDDGKMEGTSGSVRIISAGLPIKWVYRKDRYDTNKIAIDVLMNDFENIIFQGNSIGIKEIKGSELKDEKIASRITTLTLSELNTSYNALYKTNRSLNDASEMDDKYGLFYLKGYPLFYYYLATPREDDAHDLYCFSDEGIQFDSDARLGIRPVIDLKEGLRGKFEDGVWKIMD